MAAIDLTYEWYMKHIMNDGFMKPKLRVQYPLFRYRANIGYVVDEIINDHIYLASIDALNDPFDSSFALTFEEALEQECTMSFYLSSCHFLKNEQWFIDIKQRLVSQDDQWISLGDFADMLGKESQKAGGCHSGGVIAKLLYKTGAFGARQRIPCGNVACFSETWTSVPMWSYYANSHKGVCLKYDFDLLDKNDQGAINILNALQKVWYSERRPIDSDQCYSPFVKGLQWAHEQEWRLFRMEGEQYVHLPCLSEIYVGVNCEPDDLELIAEAAMKSVRDIKIFVMRPAPDTFGFVKIPLRYK